MHKIKRLVSYLIILSLLITCITMNVSAVSQPKSNSSNKQPFKWETDISHMSKDLYGVVYGDYKFVAVGKGGEIITSPDGEKWTRQKSPSNVTWEFILFNGKVFVAGGTDGVASQIITSGDGVNWQISYNDFSDYSSIKYGTCNGDSFVITGSGYLLYSTDGQSWCRDSSIHIKKAMSDGIYPDQLSRAVWDGRQYSLIKLCPDDNDYSNYTSQDGKQWNTSKVLLPEEIQPNIWNSYYLYSGSRYLLIWFEWVAGNYNNNGKYVCKSIESEDLTTWKVSDNSNAFDKMFSIEQKTGNSKDNANIICGISKNILSISKDGDVFENIITASEDTTINDAASSDKVIVAVGSGGAIYTVDKYGQEKSVIDDRFYSVYAAAQNDKIIVAVGQYGQIIVTSDKKKWSKENSGTKENLNAVMYDGKRFIAAGDKGVMIYSEDGASWSRIEVPTEMKILGLCKLNGSFFAYGDGAMILRSEDGLKWDRVYGIEPLADSSYEPIATIDFNGKSYTAPFFYNRFIYLESKDGITWNKKINNSYDFSNNEENSVIYKGKGLWLKGDATGNISYSPDGIIWKDALMPQIEYSDPDGHKYSSPLGGQIKAICKFKSRYYIFHSDGILTTGIQVSEIPSESPVTIEAFNPHNSPDPMYKELKNQPVFSNGRILVDVGTIAQYADAKVSVSVKDSKVTITKLSVSMNGSKATSTKKTVVFYANSTVSYLNGKKTILTAKTILKNKVYYVDALSAFSALGFKASYKPELRRIYVD